MLPQCDSQSVIGVALWKHQQLLSGCLSDVASGLSNRNRQFSTEPLNQSLPHDAHECGISHGTTLAFLEVRRCDNAFVEFLMTAITKGDEIARSVAAYLPALQMVDVKPDLFFLGCVCSTTLASVVVSPKHVLTHIVVTIHLALLVILTLRNGLSIRNGFQQLQVELGGLYDHFAHGQDAANPLD